MFYFGITTMTTVGFGDLNPKSNWERVFTSFWMLFGVATFSVIMSHFLLILSSLSQIGDYDEGDNLTKFLNAIKQFNGDEKIDIKFKHKMEKYFDYRWQTERNLLLSD